jgi:hypothetical protein
MYSVLVCVLSTRVQPMRKQRALRLRNKYVSWYMYYGSSEEGGPPCSLHALVAKKGLGVRCGDRGGLALYQVVVS